MGRYEYFDILRAIAIIPVMIVHFYSPLAPGGGIGVSIFFVLSGYLIGATLLHEGLSGDVDNQSSRFRRKISIRFKAVLRFLIRRIFRIVPLYYAVVFTVLFLMHATKSMHYHAFEASLSDLLLFSKKLRWVGYAVGVFWTLHIEMFFYLLIALLYMLIGKSGIYRYMPLIFAVALILAIFNPAPLLFIGLGRLYQYLPLLMLGLLLNHEVINRFGKKIKPGYAIVAIGLALVLFFIIFRINKPKFSQIAFLLFNYLAAVNTAILIIVSFSLPLDKLRLPMLSGVGLISYSLYLTHGLILDYGDYLGIVRLPHGFWYFFIISIIVSTLTFELIERPFIRFSRLLCRRI
jgi:peptidoglycan/LPS O-acetylase OafA/YrhL